MRVAVFGAGYVGLTTGITFAWLGIPVTLVDVDPAKVEAIQEGRPPIYEEHLDGLLKTVREQETLRATLDAQEALLGADAAFIAVNTPSARSGEADMQYVESASVAIGRHLDPTHPLVVVTKSTVPIGSANSVKVWVEDGFRAVHGTPPPEGLFTVASNPEFLREGQALRDSFYPDRIVIGSDEAWAEEVLKALYRPLLTQDFPPPPGLARPDGLQSVPLAVSDRISAEVIKYAANAFLATKISFANEMARLCDEVGADVVRVMDGIGLDSRIGRHPLDAGVGWGGSCFGKDLAALIHTAREYGLEPRLIEATVAVNQAQRHLAVKHLQQLLKTLRGRRVAVWGLAFKPGTDDLRDSPSLTVIDEILALGARITAYDPIAMDNARRVLEGSSVTFAASALDAADGAEALLVMTAWPEFRHVDLTDLRNRLRLPVVVDGRNLFDPGTMRDQGFVYRGIGRGAGLR
jgi:UDPglucose 6-dehydrogenase